jgi:hypothetical protein
MVLRADYGNAAEDAQRRVEWAGVISDPPQPDASGMKISARLLERQLDRPVGSDVDLLTLSSSDQFVVMAPGESLLVEVSYIYQQPSNQEISTVRVFISGPHGRGEIVTLDEWAAAADSTLRQALSDALATEDGSASISAVYGADSDWFAISLTTSDSNVSGLTLGITHTVAFITPAANVLNRYAVLGVALGNRPGQWLSLDVETDDLQPVWDKIAELRPNIAATGDEEEFLSGIDGGEFDIGITLAATALEAEGLAWVTPKEGSTVSTEAFWVPAGLPVETTYWVQVFINETLAAENQTLIAENLGEVPTNLGATLPDFMVEDPATFPFTEEDIEKYALVFPVEVGAKNNDEWQAAYTAAIQG